MNEDVLNMSVRRFLKQVGVTSQRAIETAVREAAPRLKGKKGLKAAMTLEVGELGLVHQVKGTIKLG